MSVATNISSAIVAALRSVRCGSGDFVAVVNKARFAGLSYAQACIVYEAAKKAGATCVLANDNRSELIRRSWGHETVRGCSP